MSHIHRVTRQNKLEIPRDKDEVNKREIHEYDDRACDPDTMIAPLTPKPTRKAEALARAPPTIASRQESPRILIFFHFSSFLVFLFFKKKHWLLTRCSYSENWEEELLTGIGWVKCCVARATQQRCCGLC